MPYKRLMNIIQTLFNPPKRQPLSPAITTRHLIKLPPPIQLPAKQIPRAQHSVSRKNISKNAVKVLYQLHQSGYQAFLVGGGIRDLLLGLKPKDFDVATNASPEQVRQVFRNCRLIGRRFLLAHVHFGQEIIEVATFRKQHDESGDGVIENGCIIRDNVYGTIDEDACRRDFTINALYYDISNFSLLDYADGMADLQAKIIRLIGNPVERYQEDPVRMLRAVRLAAKLGFEIEPETAKAIHQFNHLLENTHAARLYEEVLKMFLGGYAYPSFVKLREFGLFKRLFPQTEACLDDPIALALVEQALKNTDERVAADKSVTPAFLLAALLWFPILRLIPEYRDKGLSEQDCLVSAIDKVIDRQIQRISIPRRVTILSHEIWLLQPRLTRPKTKRSLRIMTHQRFRAGYDFLYLRAQAGENVADSAQWWTQVQTMDEAQREQFFDTVPSHRSNRNNRRRKKKKPPTTPV